jgi:hypothetical protein
MRAHCFISSRFGCGALWARPDGDRRPNEARPGIRGRNRSGIETIDQKFLNATTAAS